jgi:glycine cleavage system H lipoate-binding protein
MAIERTHTYHAEADVLSVKLERPLQAEVRPQAYVKLPDHGGYFSERAENFRLESVISFRSAYTQVAGNRNEKQGHGWVTLATAVVEGLNVLDVVTADRVVAQFSTEHPLVGYVPRVTFLGTRFEGLKIGGVDVRPKIDLDFCAPTKGDQLYLEDAAFRGKVEEQNKKMASAPEALRRKEGGTMPDPAELRKEWNAYIDPDPKKRGPRPKAAVDCSIVTSLGETGPWKSAGNAIEVPEFGRVFFGELRVECDSFEFAMIRLDMGCVAGGKGKVTTYAVNGGTRP